MPLDDLKPYFCSSGRTDLGKIDFKVSTSEITCLAHIDLLQAPKISNKSDPPRIVSFNGSMTIKILESKSWVFWMNMERKCIKSFKLVVHGDFMFIVTARSSGVRPRLSKGRYGHVSTHLDNPTCPSSAHGNGKGGISNKLLRILTRSDTTCNGPILWRPTGVIERALWTFPPTSIYFYLKSCAQENGKGGMSNKLLSEVTLDQPARMTLYTTLCGN
ncbi:hypothetical protein IGI04_040470 [Brassica rapa subsp. trilocularis]|uniref:Uncharacterized protein n=1 Tax=Brassica rapa subsp. trilocularis TaxID=1813537 RepID=A0ABQ7KNS8_BRACM|nr:hypothetical protein IGI04_040470 [Brassica rapa subsp. trilocularis]